MMMTSISIRRFLSPSIHRLGKFSVRSTNSCCQFFSSNSNNNDTSASSPEPLLLWLGNNNNDSTSSSSDNNTVKPLILSSKTVQESAPIVQTVDDIVQNVDAYYSSDNHFVGGMGEQDPGVWFASQYNDDVLNYASILKEAINIVKEQRHGVPFGVYTTGTVIPDDIPLLEIGIDTYRVSLFAANPNDYKNITNTNNFGLVCSFIADASEQGLAVEVSVLKQYSIAARELATSLGVRQVHVHDDL